MSKIADSIKGHNPYGKIIAGIALIILAILLAQGGRGALGFVCAAVLLIVAAVALYSFIARKRGPKDEVADAHDGKASSLALKITLIVLGVACLVGLLTGTVLNLAAMCCFAIGLAMLIYGCVFARLQKK